MFDRSLSDEQNAKLEAVPEPERVEMVLQMIRDTGMTAKEINAVWKLGVGTLDKLGKPAPQTYGTLS